MDQAFYQDYSKRLQDLLAKTDWSPVGRMAAALQQAWDNKKQIFLCGNGGSAANAIHLANDFIYGINKAEGIGMRVHALPSNQAVMTCLGNDISYDDIYSQQLRVLGSQGDQLIVLSGSGNSPNIVKALEVAKELGITSHAILGYKGGKAKELADVVMHFPIDDMQISEDCQQIVGHMIMRRLCKSPMAC